MLKEERCICSRPTRTESPPVVARAPPPGHPLYYFVGDKAAGDVTGEGIDQFGAKWYVVGKDGMKIDND
jgi:predicted lipoprotein with Yx(FWY)xxD motif